MKSFRGKNSALAPTKAGAFYLRCRIIHRQNHEGVQAMIKWTEERIALMLKLLDEGKSAGVVGAALGTTRNAIIGKVGRLGYAVGVLNGHHLRHPPRVRRERPRLTISIFGNRVRPVLRLKPVPVKPAAPFVPGEANCTIMQLTKHTCRWPMWEADGVEKFYCGALVDGKTYCAEHWEVAGNVYIRPRHEPPRPFFTKKRSAKSPKSMVA